MGGAALSQPIQSSDGCALYEGSDPIVGAYLRFRFAFAPGVACGPRHPHHGLCSVVFFRRWERPD